MTQTHRYDIPGVKRCRSCNAEVYWLKHEKTGKAAPINVGGDPQGNITVSLSAGTYRVESKARLAEMRAELAEKGFIGGVAGAPCPHVLHTNHFQTCPASGAWKRHGSSGSAQRSAQRMRGPKNGEKNGEKKGGS